MPRLHIAIFMHKLQKVNIKSCISRLLPLISPWFHHYVLYIDISSGYRSDSDVNEQLAEDDSDGEQIILGPEHVSVTPGHVVLCLLVLV